MQMPSQEIHINNSNITIKVSGIDIIISESKILTTFYIPCKQCRYLWELLTDSHTHTRTHIILKMYHYDEIQFTQKFTFLICLLAVALN